MGLCNVSFHQPFIASRTLLRLDGGGSILCLGGACCVDKTKSAVMPPMPTTNVAATSFPVARDMRACERFRPSSTSTSRCKDGRRNLANVEETWEPNPCMYFDAKEGSRPSQPGHGWFLVANRGTCMSHAPTTMHAFQVH
mmetsp:Transcript_3729/g.23418  ORF Transcript_3729/g.23418 Transcript_3729/m.23418 type:complete len:140 (+) Transcript_3729:1752-2171(+)